MCGIIMYIYSNIIYEIKTIFLIITSDKQNNIETFEVRG